MNNFKEKLSCARVEYEDGSIDGLRRQITFERLVDCHTVYVSIIYEPRGQEKNISHIPMKFQYINNNSFYRSSQ